MTVNVTCVNSFLCVAERRVKSKRRALSCSSLDSDRTAPSPLLHLEAAFCTPAQTCRALVTEHLARQSVAASQGALATLEGRRSSEPEEWNGTERNWYYDGEYDVPLYQEVTVLGSAVEASTTSGSSPYSQHISPVSSTEDMEQYAARHTALPPALVPLGTPLLGAVPPPSNPPLSYQRRPMYYFEDEGFRGSWAMDERMVSLMTHNRVPKTKNLKELYGKQLSGDYTTLMVRNLPNRYKQKDFVEELHTMGFPAGAWDFLYVPVDTHNNSSVGYAFVNFAAHDLAAQAMRAFDGYRWRKYRKQTSKPAAVNKAHIQGLANNIDHFSRTAIKDARIKQHRPLILNGASEIPDWATAVDAMHCAPCSFFVPVRQL